MSPNPTLEDQVRKTLALFVAVVAVLSGLLSGCSTDAGTAARVGDAVITQHQVDELARELTAVPDFAANDVKPEQLGTLAVNLLVRGELARTIAAKHPQVQIPASLRSEALAAMPAEIAGNDKLRAAFSGDTDFILLANLLGNTVEQVLGSIPVELNPRLGSWDPSTQTVAATNESLSTPWMPKR